MTRNPSNTTTEAYDRAQEAALDAQDTGADVRAAARGAAAALGVDLPNDLLASIVEDVS